MRRFSPNPNYSPIHPTPSRRKIKAKVQRGKSEDAVSLIYLSKMHALQVTESIKAEATKLDEISDEIDTVNQIKGEGGEYDGESAFDAGKDKQGFRRYEEACDRVKNFYAVCPPIPHPTFPNSL